jgi:hypothetical protein
MDKKFVPVYIARGTLEAETVRVFLESEGINAFVLQESAGVVYGLTVGSLGAARVMVESQDEDHAKTILRAMEAGEYELPTDEVYFDNVEDAEKDAFDEEDEI